MARRPVGTVHGVDDDPGTAAPRWQRVSITVDEADAELGADLLWGAGAAGIEEQDADGRVRLLGGFEDPAAAELAHRRAIDAGYDVVILEVDDDGLDAWRTWAEPVRAGHTWIVPTWVEPPPVASDERQLLIDPGRSFGSGSHPTTRLVVTLLEDLVAPADRVLDVGAGSGVLAIAAAVLGARSALAIDIDPESPTVTVDNARRNGVGDVVSASSASLAEVVAGGASFELVAANLLAPVIAELAADLVAAVAPGGTLVVSGLLADRWEASMPALEPLAVVRVEVEDGWAAVALR